MIKIIYTGENFLQILEGTVDEIASRIVLNNDFKRFYNNSFQIRIIDVFENEYYVKVKNEENKNALFQSICALVELKELG